MVDGFTIDIVIIFDELPFASDSILRTLVVIESPVKMQLEKFVLFFSKWCTKKVELVRHVNFELVY